MVQKDTQFVMKNNQVQQPFIPTDGLELYYDVKGKKNTDNYKDKLLDMSGNGRHGVLSNFAYEGVSGYRGTTEGGLLLDDVDDKIFRPAIDGVEYTSASRNLFDKSNIIMGKYHNSGGVLNNEPSSSGSEFFVEVESGRTYTWGDIDRYKIIVMTFDENKSPLERFTTYTILSRQFNSNVKYVQFSSYQVNYTFSDFQVEEGTVATPYTQYVPLPIMTYQMNGNILSFEKDGTVKRTTKDANGNEVVVSRKGINLVRNGNFTNGKDKWMGGVKLASAIVDSSSVVLTANTESGEHYFDQNFRMPSPSSKYLVKFKIKSIIGRGYIVAYNYRLDGTYENLGRSSIVSEGVETELSFIVENTTTHLVNPHIIVRLQLSNTSAQGIFTGSGEKSSFTDIQLINLTEAYGSGNEPTLAYIQSHPEEFAWTPNPNDLIETVEIKNNLVGDLENLQGNDFEQHEDGVITYTNEAEEGSVVRVDIDGISFQDVGSGKNIFYKNEVYSKDSEINDDCINISIGDRFFYPIDGVSNAQYTTSFDYERDNTTAPISMSFYYTDGTSDENSQIMSSSDRVRLTLSSAIGKTVSGVGYNPPVVLGCSWKKISNPTMERTGLAIDTAQEDESLGVRWNKLQNPIMERV